jgi:flagellar FliL protein
MTMTAPSPRATEAAEEAEAPAGGKKKKLVVGVLVLALLGGGYWFFLRPTGDEAPKPGAVLRLDPTQVNLAGGHYLKIGLALQGVEGGHELDGSIAMDAAIDLFSGRSMAEVSTSKERRKLKKELEHTLEERYHGDVMGVYFTEYVTQ